LSAGCVFLIGFSLNEAVGDGGQLPEAALAGTYTITLGGSFAVCTGPSPTFTQIACSGFNPSSDLFFPQTVAQIGVSTADSNGNNFGTFTQTISDLPVDFSPPLVQTFNSVAHITNYDPSTGQGDSSGTSYTGGSCDGANFNSSGSTVLSTFSVHFVASPGRLDELVTALQNPVGSIGDFSVTATARQLEGDHGHHHD
jgi:hypothetical protein